MISYWPDCYLVKMIHFTSHPFNIYAGYSPVEESGFTYNIMKENIKGKTISLLWLMEI